MRLDTVDATHPSLIRWCWADPARLFAVSLGLCVVIVAVLAFAQLGQRPLLDAEARYALIGEEMLRSGDFIQPRLNTFPYYEKPPLLYWAIALSYRVFGVNELASRLPSALAHVGTTVLVCALAHAILGRPAAPLAGLIYATAAGPSIYARYCLPDGLLVFWLTLSLLGFARTIQGAGGWLLFSVGAAGATLTKGFVGLVFPLAAAVIYVAIARDRAIISRLHPVRSSLVVLGLGLPWHLILAARDPAFLHFYVVNEHIYRFLNMREPMDYVPLSLVGFWASTLFWFLPWALFLPDALFRIRDVAAPLTLPLIWSAIVIGFFSVAGSRLERYGLPALPTLAIVIAGYWSALAEHRRRRTAVILPSLLVIALGLGMLGVAGLTPAVGSPFTSLVADLDGHYREHPAEALLFVREAIGLAPRFSMWLLALGVATYLAARAGRVRLAFLLWVVLLVPVLHVVDGATRILTPNRSQREAALIITREWQDGARVVVGGLYDDAMSVTFYTRRPTYILDRNSTDLAFGLRQAVGSPLTLTSAQLHEYWRSPGRVFLLTERRPFPDPAFVLLDRPTYTLVTNHPPAASTVGGPR